MMSVKSCFPSLADNMSMYRFFRRKMPGKSVGLHETPLGATARPLPPLLICEGILAVAQACREKGGFRKLLRIMRLNVHYFPFRQITQKKAKPKKPSFLSDKRAWLFGHSPSGGHRLPSLCRA